MASSNIDQCMDAYMEECTPDNDPRDIPSLNERRAISDFLNGRIPAGEAAIAYTRDLIEDKTSGYLADLVYEIAQHLTETHDRLIELVTALTALPNEPHASGAIQDWSRAVQLDVYWELREHWNGQLSLIKSHPDTAQHEQFINLTVFIARLSAEGLITTDYFALVMMHVALESEEEPRVLDTYVVTAAQYFEKVGGDVFEEAHRHLLSPGELLRKASQDFGIVRWQFWKMRMRVLGEREDLEQRTRDFARLTLGRMIDVEQTHIGSRNG